MDDRDSAPARGTTRALPHAHPHPQKSRTRSLSDPDEQDLGAQVPELRTRSDNRTYDDGVPRSAAALHGAEAARDQVGGTPPRLVSAAPPGPTTASERPPAALEARLNVRARARGWTVFLCRLDVVGACLSMTPVTESWSSRHANHLSVAQIQLTQEHTAAKKRFSFFYCGDLHEFEAPSVPHAHAWVQAIEALQAIGATGADTSTIERTAFSPPSPPPARAGRLVSTQRYPAATVLEVSLDRDGLRSFTFLRKKRLHRDGRVVVVDVKRGGAAYAAGIKVNDAVLRVNGDALDVQQALRQAATSVKRRLTVTLRLWRLLDSHDSLEGQDTCVYIEADTRGMHVQQRGPGSGIRVVQATGAATVAGMRAGDVLVGVHHIPLPASATLANVQHLLESLPRPVALNLSRPSSVAARAFAENEGADTIEPVAPPRSEPGGRRALGTPPLYDPQAEMQKEKRRLLVQLDSADERMPRVS